MSITVITIANAKFSAEIAREQRVNHPECTVVDLHSSADFANHGAAAVADKLAKFTIMVTIATSPILGVYAAVVFVICSIVSLIIVRKSRLRYAHVSNAHWCTLDMHRFPQSKFIFVTSRITDVHAIANACRAAIPHSRTLRVIHIRTTREECNQRFGMSVAGSELMVVYKPIVIDRISAMLT